MGVSSRSYRAKNRRKASPSVRRQLAALTKSTAEKRMPCSSTSTSPGSKRPRHSGSLSASRAAIEPAKTMVNGSSGLGNPGWASSTRQPVSANRRAPASAIRRVSGSTGAYPQSGVHATRSPATPRPASAR